jgi:hypothetical protein
VVSNRRISSLVGETAPHSFVGDNNTACARPTPAISANRELTFIASRAYFIQIDHGAFLLLFLLRATQIIEAQKNGIVGR